MFVLEFIKLDLIFFIFKISSHQGNIFPVSSNTHKNLYHSILAKTCSCICVIYTHKQVICMFMYIDHLRLITALLKCIHTYEYVSSWFVCVTKTSCIQVATPTTLLSFIQINRLEAYYARNCLSFVYVRC